MDSIQKYVEITKKELSKYMSTIFEKDYDKNIFEDIFKNYINVRYYDINQKIKKKEDLRKEVLSELQEQKKILVKKYDKIKVNNMCEAFEYIIYFDNVGKFKQIENIITKIVEFREEKLNRKESKEFTKTLNKLVQEYSILKQEHITNFETKNFKLNNKKTGKNNLILTTLRYNIEFPKAFKASIVEEVYNSGITKEDRILVEYNLLNNMLLKDIIRGDFYKEYLIEFEVALLNKKSKLSRVLKIIGNEDLKEKINLLIEYKDFTNNNKSDIYSLMRQGYKIAVKLDEEDKKLDEKQINRLNVFSYVLIKDKTIYSKELTKVKQISKKVVII